MVREGSVRSTVIDEIRDSEISDERISVRRVVTHVIAVCKASNCKTEHRLGVYSPVNDDI